MSRTSQLQPLPPGAAVARSPHRRAMAAEGERTSPLHDNETAPERLCRRMGGHGREPWSAVIGESNHAASAFALSVGGIGRAIGADGGNAPAVEIGNPRARAPNLSDSGRRWPPDSLVALQQERNERALDRLERDVAIATELLATFVRYFLTITPPLPASETGAARALGQRRFE